MDGRTFVAAKEVFHHRNGIIWHYENCNHLNLRNTHPCNFLTKRALMSQPSTLMVAKESNISHCFNLTFFLPMIILPII